MGQELKLDFWKLCSSAKPAGARKGGPQLKGWGESDKNVKRIFKKVLVAVMTAIMYPQLRKDREGYSSGIEYTLKVALDILWEIDRDPLN